jgi:hypothetical protein
VLARCVNSAIWISNGIRTDTRVYLMLHPHNVTFYVNLQGFLIVDRTLYKAADGSYKYFLPNATNVLKFKDPKILTATDPNAWQAFAGRWGNSIPIQSDPGPPNCLNIEQTTFVDCPT